MESNGEKQAFYIFDKRMSDFHQSLPSKDDPSMIYKSPEVPDRTINIHKYLKEHGILQKMENISLG